jgi:hypothetical protein
MLQCMSPLVEIADIGRLYVEQPERLARTWEERPRALHPKSLKFR